MTLPLEDHTGGVDVDERGDTVRGRPPCPSRTVTTPASRPSTTSTASSPSRSKDAPSKLEQASAISDPYDRDLAPSLDDPRHDALDVNADTGGVDPTQVNAKCFHRFIVSLRS
jgi:hypothetical protein